MMKHIAVVLRGHIRTWNIIYQDVFDFYDSIAEKVDYYFVTWSIPNFDFTPTKLRFAGKELVEFMILPKTQIWYTSWYGPSLMTYMIRPYMEQRMKSVKYDAIFETRPDVAAKLRPYHYIPEPEENKLYVSQIEIHVSNLTKKKTVALTDFWFMSNYDVFKKMSERFITPPIHGNQVDYRLHADKENIGINILSVETILARPNCHTLKGSIRDRFSELYDLHESWSRMPSEQKVLICNQQNVNVIDYMTTSITCKI